MAPNIRTTASRLVYENRWMRLREDAIVRQDGSPGIYGVVEKADFAIIAPVENGMIHLVEQYRYPVQGRYWELPQGSWEDSPGTDPLELARAELREETGLIGGDDAAYRAICSNATVIRTRASTSTSPRASGRARRAASIPSRT